METVDKYDNWKGASPMDEEVREVDACFWCGKLEDDDTTLINFYDNELKRDVPTCKDCSKDIAKGVL